MPEMNLKEAIEKLLKIEPQLWRLAGTLPIGIDEYRDALKLAISKLSLLEQVEEGGAEKRKCSCPEPESDGGKDLECWCGFRQFNSAIDLCNAEWAGRLNKLKNFSNMLLDTLFYLLISEEDRELFIKKKQGFIQDIITHLTGGKK